MAEKKGAGFSDEEKAAMQERAMELAAGKPDGESAVLAKIAGMQEPDRSIATRLHAIIKAAAPDLTPRTWYGSPAYSNKEGKVVLFFQDRGKFKTRYGNLGFSDSAHLDDGNMWPVAYALKEMNPAEEARIAALVKKAVG
jgi:hypothetical protein